MCFMLLPTKPVAKVELCSIKQVECDMRLGCEAWLMLIQPATHVVATEADTCAEGDVASGSRNDATLLEFYRPLSTPMCLNPPVCLLNVTQFIESNLNLAQYHHTSGSTESLLLQLAEVRWQLDEYLKKGWIRPSCLPYGAPIIFIQKKTGELRMTVDYRALNRQTKKDVYPLPRIDDLLDKLSKARFLSAIDLASGYH